MRFEPLRRGTRVVRLAQCEADVELAQSLRHLAFVAGRQDAATAFTWDTLTEVDDERVAAGNNSYMTTAWAQDVTSGVPYSITGSLAGSTFRHSMIAMAITPSP